MQIECRYASCLITNGAENFVSQTLQFQKEAARRQFTSRAGIGQCRPNQRFVEV